MSFLAHPAYSFAVVVAPSRRCSSSSRLACHRGRRHPCQPRASSAVDRFVDRFAARLAARPLSPSCLSCGGAACGAGSVLSSRAWPLLVVPSSWPRSAHVGRLGSLIRLLACRLDPCGGRWHGGSWLVCLRPLWLVRLAFAGEALRRVCRSHGLSRRLPRCPYVLAWRRRAAGVGVSCLRLALPRYAYRPASHVERRGDIFFLPLRAANQRGMRACIRS